MASPVRQPESESPVTTQAVRVADDSADETLGDISKKDFSTLLETTLITTLNNREEAQRKAEENKVRKAAEKGITLWTPDNAVKRCTEYMNSLANEYNLYKTQNHSISEQQQNALDTAKAQNETVKRLETIVGRIEDVQGVKAPKRPPFPSWACLAYLLWHWPMYAFATLWLSKYFRRFCFLITFFVIVVETCLIFLLASDNSLMHRDRTKYVTVRNWSLVEGDTATINKFDYVDFIFSDAKFHDEDIKALNETIRMKYDVMME